MSLTEIERNGIKIGRKEFLEIIRYINHLGGIIVIDYLSLEELKDKIINHFYKVNKK